MSKKLIRALIITLSVTFLNPLSIKAKADPEIPKLSGKSFISIDAKTGEIIYAQKADDKMYPASTTKLMTALLFAENKKKDDLIPYTESAKKQPEFSLNRNIKPIALGETMVASDVMKALLLFSANDAAYMIADSVGKNSDDFIAMMNKKAKDLNLNNTNFVTANGLHNDNHYTTAYDLAIIGKAAYDNPWVKEVMGIQKDTIRTSGGTVAIVENRNKNLGIDGSVGGKTGYTTPAGKCLVAMYERDGRTIIGVVLKSVYDRDDVFVFNDMTNLINYSFEVKPKTLYSKDQVVKTLSVEYKLFRFFGPKKVLEVPLYLQENVNYYDNEINSKELDSKVEEAALNPWKLSKDSKAGVLKVSERNVNRSIDLYSKVGSKDIIKANKWLYFGVSAVALVVLIGIAIIFNAITNKFKRRRRYY